MSAVLSELLTHTGTLIAAQGLAKLAITADPNIAFPGSCFLFLRPVIHVTQVSGRWSWSSRW